MCLRVFAFLHKSEHHTRYLVFVKAREDSGYPGTGVSNGCWAIFPVLVFFCGVGGRSVCVGTLDLVMYSWLAWHWDCRAVHLKLIVIHPSALCPKYWDCRYVVLLWLENCVYWCTENNFFFSHFAKPVPPVLMLPPIFKYTLVILLVSLPLPTRLWGPSPFKLPQRTSETQTHPHMVNTAH